MLAFGLASGSRPSTQAPSYEPKTTITPSVSLTSFSPDVSTGERENTLSTVGKYPLVITALETSGGASLSPMQQNSKTATRWQHIAVAPWMESSGPLTVTSTSGFGTSFFYDTNHKKSQSSPLSPSDLRLGAGLNSVSNLAELTGESYFPEERRPSVASISSQSSSKSSVGPTGIHKKLQTFFGDDFPGRNGSNSSLPSHGKEVRSQSFARRQRNRAASSATDAARQREASPADVRPRTPVPSRDVVPFLYQDLQDITKYGEAPVRENLSGPDKDRYAGDHAINMAKVFGSRPSHPLLPVRNFKYADEVMTSLSGISAEDAIVPARSRDRVQTSVGGALRNEPSSTQMRNAKSPVPGTLNTVGLRSGVVNTNDGSISPTIHARRGILGRFRKHKEKDSANLPLKDLPGSPWTHNSPGSRNDLSRGPTSPDFPVGGPWSREGSIVGSEVNNPLRPEGGIASSRSNNLPRQGAFSKLQLRKPKPKTATDEADANLEYSENNDNFSGTMFSLDTNLNNMEGILAKPPPLTPLENRIPDNVEDHSKTEAESIGSLGWDAPDSWAVKRLNDDSMSRLSEIHESDVPPTEDEKSNPYCIRIFRIDGTFATLSTPLNATVAELMNQLGRKTYMTDALANYQIVMKKHDLKRILGPGERPVMIQKRLLEQAGYEERDRIEDVGREDNSYLCRFSFTPARESGYATVTADPSAIRVQKFNHVDLSGRNLVTIPIALYSKASEIISLNLSRNLSLDLPKDFIQSCQNLREVKFINNEAWKLPQSLSCATRLKFLDVSNNRLENLDQAELGRLQSLVSLKIANNRLRSLMLYFGQFKSLRTLNVSSNFLSSFPGFLCNLKSLVDINMSFNSIASLPDEIGQLSNLERFVMTNNRLKESLPANFGQLVNLKEVDVRYNNLSSINVIAKLPIVEQIFADHNSVSVCESTFTKIRVLRLNSNPVTKFEILNVVPTLTTLNLSNAKLAHIPDAAFEKMPNLVKLVLDINHFVSLPIHIGRLQKLEHFSIARNALSSLPVEIGCLTELRFLDVRQNNLKKLPIELWWAKKLETLNISSNVLENFPMPGSRPPQVPGEVSILNPQGVSTVSHGLNSANSSFEELGALEAFGQRRPSQLSNGLGASENKSSVVSAYGKSGRKTSNVSRNGVEVPAVNLALPLPQPRLRRDSGNSSRLINTFARSLKNLYLADNQLDDDVFDKLILLSELRILNLSYNDLNDMPQRSIKSWPLLTELYLSGNELTCLPSDDFEEFSLLQVLHINGNKFQTLPAELGKAHRLAVLDCGSNSLKYNVSNWPYDWNWNWNTNLKYLNLSGNKRLEIKPSAPGGAGNRDGRDLTNFNALQKLRILGLMDVTLTIPSIPDQTEDRRVRTSGSVAGQLSYGMADTLGKSEHLSIIDMLVPRFNSSEAETLMGMFDGESLSGGGSKIAKFLHENFGHTFSEEMKRINTSIGETPADALRRAFLSLNKDLATAATQHTEERSLLSHRGSAALAVLSQADLHSGGVATVVFLQNSELFVANVGDAQAMLIHSEGGHRILTRKHDPAEPNERQRIRDAGGWVSRQGKLNDVIEVSRAFGYVQLMPVVQAAPHISHFTVKEQDEMILIASRELWEYLSLELVVDIARYDRGDLMRASQRLRDLAIAFGATKKLMVMMMGVSDLKKRAQIRPHRVQSLFLSPGTNLDDIYAPARRPRKKGETVEDSGLRRLEAEVDAPVGDVSIAFTDIKSSTLLWETYPSAMRSAIKLHNEVMRRQLRIIGGYEVKTEGDAFMVSFPTATSALLWCFAVQQALLEVQWPSEVLSSVLGQEIYDNDQTLIFKGLSVRMGVHWGHPVCETDPVTRRMDYFGPMVNRAARISAVADGGQITVSADFISEIQRCLETYSENERSNSTGSEEAYQNDAYSQAIRRELRSLSSQGFEVKDMGERKLKGLENPEYIYLMYPHALAGRMHYQQRPDEPEMLVSLDSPAKLSDSMQLSIETDSVWALWHVGLRLEMLCSSLEVKRGSEASLQPPEIGMMEKIKKRGGEVTDRLLLNFLAHQITRIELRGPMEDVFASLTSQLSDLRLYKMSYGDLPSKAIAGPSQRSRSDTNGKARKRSGRTTN